jgi:DNA-binding winged helix-turn-helix (wHTH) protein/predicted ATPase
VPDTQPLAFGPYRLDPRRGLWRGRREVKLAPKALVLLRFLLERAGDVLTKEEVFRAVWPDTAVSDGALTSCIRELRKALRDDARQPQYIETLHRRGYRFVAKVLSSPAPSPGPSPSVVDRPPTTTLVGREPELSQLQGWLASASEGERQIVFVTGEPGIGKTTIVEAFLRQAASEVPLRIGRGQCVDHYGAGEAYLPILDALSRLCRDPNGDAVVRTLARHAPTWLVQMPSLVGAAADLQALQRRAQAATRERMLRELTEAVEAISDVTPVVLWLEDLHWSDVSTLDWLAFLGRRSEQARLMVLTTYRPADVLANEHPLAAVKEELQRHRLCRELALRPLAVAAVEQYLLRRFTATPELAATVRSLAGPIHARSDGNPLFMVNIVDDLVARGALDEGACGWEVDRLAETSSLRVPADVRSMIERQFDRLGPTERHLLEVASVAGTEFVAPAVAAGLELDAMDVESCCTGLAQREQFVEAGGVEEWPDGTIAARYAFRHALYNQVLYERIPPARRAALHTRVGLRLEAGYGERSREMAAELAMHFERGRDLERAVRYVEAAGQNAIARNAPREAAAHLERAIDLLRSVPAGVQRAEQELSMQIALGSQLMAVDGWAAPEVERAYARAQALAEEVGDVPRLFPALWGLWLYRWGRGELVRARALGEHLLEVAVRTGDRTMVLQAHHTLWPTLLALGEPRAALDHSLEGTAQCEAGAHRPLGSLYGNHDPCACALYFGAWAASLLGLADRALEMSRQAIALARQRAHPFSEALSLFFAAAVHQCRGEPAAVRERAEAAVELAQAHGFGLVLAWATTLLGWAMSREGQADDGIAAIRRGMTATQQTGSEQFRSYFLGLLADACLSTGRFADGLAGVTEALAAAESTGERFYAAELHRLQGELAKLIAGPGSAPPSAEESLLKAVEVAREQGAKALELRAAISVGRLWRACGREAEARRMVAEIRGAFTGQLDTVDLREAEAFLDATSAR